MSHRRMQIALLVAAIAAFSGCVAPWVSPSNSPARDYIRGAVGLALAASIAAIVITALYMRQARRWHWVLPVLPGLNLAIVVCGANATGVVSSYADDHQLEGVDTGWGIGLAMLAAIIAAILAIVEWRRLWKGRPQPLQVGRLPLSEEL